MEKPKVKLKSLLKHFSYEKLNEEETSFKNVQGVYRPGLELVGFYDYMEYHKGIILGSKEITFISTQDEKRRNECYEFLTNENIPFILITNGLECPNELKEICSRKNVLLLSSKKDSLEVIEELSQYMYEKLATRKMIHGTLMDIYGNGVLLVGPSAIGKSEIALELIKRGHRLVADDSVIAYAVNRKLYGKAPRHIRGFLEVRGLGVINVDRMFGVVAFQDYSKIDFIINLVNMDDIKSADRLMNKVEEEKILDISIPLIKLPVSQGRTMSDLVEIATINYKIREKGYDATEEFTKHYDEILKGVEQDD